MAKRPVLNPEEVKQAYGELGNLHKVAERFGVSRPTLMKFMDRYGIPRQKNGEFWLSREELSAAYAQVGSTRILADHYGVCRSVIKRLCTAHGIALDPRPPKARLLPVIQRMAGDGKDNFQIADVLSLSPCYVNAVARQFGIDIQHRFHKGHIITHNGYKKVLCKESADADSKGYVAEHRQVAAQKLGLDALPKDVVVHHINGDKTDNRPENLAVMTLSEHSKLHRDESLGNIKI